MSVSANGLGSFQSIWCNYRRAQHVAFSHHKVLGNNVLDTSNAPQRLRLTFRRCMSAARSPSWPRLFRTSASERQEWDASQLLSVFRSKQDETLRSVKRTQNAQWAAGSAESSNAVLLEISSSYPYNAHSPNSPQCRRAALSSCVGCSRAHPSPPGTDPPALQHMTERAAHITTLHPQKWAPSTAKWAIAAADEKPKRDATGLLHRLFRLL